MNWKKRYNMNNGRKTMMLYIKPPHADLLLQTQQDDHSEWLQKFTLMLTFKFTAERNTGLKTCCEPGSVDTGYETSSNVL